MRRGIRRNGAVLAASGQSRRTGQPRPAGVPRPDRQDVPTTMPALRAAAHTALGAACLTLAAPAGAQEDATALALDPIVVSAPEDNLGSGMASGTSVGRDDLLGSFQGADLPAVLGTIPGVTTETTPGDPSIAVNIRGLQGKGRVVVTIDGARQNFAKSDHGPNGTFFADPEMLRSVEVVRGPAGADAAAGAIGGTLALRTIEAADLIDPGAVQGGEARLRYGTLTEAPTVHLAYAHALGARADILVAGTRAQAGDYEAGDGTDVAAAETNLSGLAKLSFTPTDSQQLVLGWSGIDSTFRTGVYSGIPRDNDMQTSNLTLNYSLDGRIPTTATLYRTSTAVDQQLLDDDDRPIGPSRAYTTITNGLRGEAEAGFAAGPSDHALTFVLDAFHDSVTTDDPTDLSLTPSGNRTVASLLAQDAIALTPALPGLTAIAALRFDSYRLESDDGEADGAQVSPALTLRQQVGQALSLYATVARAYRPPSLSESLVSGMHPEPADFYVRPNPNLKPESSLTTEVGASLALPDLIRPGDMLTAQLAAYRNDVTDFIGLVEQGTLFDSWLIYDNIDEARIEGIELEIAYDADQIFGSLSGQLIRGTDETTDEDLTGIAPSRLVVSGGWRNRPQTLEIGARLTLTGSAEDPLLSSEAWHTVDLFLTRAIGSRGSFGLALNNITNETYTQYLNTQPSPGFNALASLSLTF